MKADRPLVSVIIPAFNAEATIMSTLHSVQLQTLRNIEIIVVDDGSTDATRRLVEELSRSDERIRILEQQNGGVAAARNAGIATARADYIAPIDADDLWHPRKLGAQLELMTADPEQSLVYTWYYSIGPDGLTIRMHTPSIEGKALQDLFRANFIGNGSSAMMKTQQVQEVGGYDPGLRAQRAQGCEDLALYLRLAECGLFGVVRRPFTGYRVQPENMSGDSLQMLKSFDLVQSPYRTRHPDKADIFNRGRMEYISYLLSRSAFEGKWRAAFQLWIEANKQNPTLALQLLDSPAIARSIIPPPVRKMIKSFLKTEDQQAGKLFEALT
ncbi:MAG TPA: glycosyltransferase family 2 protein [Hyphomicrobium sp.]|nr:glycosyltransferase family 2 protein [Hyphomicrobium sp.]